MTKWAIPAVVCGALLGAAGCSKAEKEPSARTAAAPNKDALAFLQGFASAIVDRDYSRAYAAVAAERHATLSQQDFEEAFRHYRDELPDGLKTEVRVDPYDGEGSLVPEELRSRIVAEGVVHFLPGEGAEGFSATVWILMESGQPKLASFYVED